MKADVTSLTRTLQQIAEQVKSDEGILSPDEVLCLATLAAVPTVEGEILEIGSFQRKSTIVLAKASLLANQVRIVAVDPLTSPCSTDPDLALQAQDGAAPLVISADCRSQTPAHLLEKADLSSCPDVNSSKSADARSVHQTGSV